jgi:hypothetical protein
LLVPANPPRKHTPASASGKAEEKTGKAGPSATASFFETLSSIRETAQRVEQEADELPLDQLERVFTIQHKLLFVAYSSALAAGFNEAQAMSLAEYRLEKMLNS